MILGLIEDYQKIITNPETCSNVIVALTELIKHLLDTKMQMIENDIMERRKSAEVACYIAALKDHISKLEIQNNKLLESMNGEFETVFEMDSKMDASSSGLLADENAKKMQTYLENNTMLESVRNELERVCLGYPPVPTFPKSGECMAKVDELQIQMDSVVNKMTDNISYDHALIEQLSVKYTVISNRLQELENKIEPQRPTETTVQSGVNEVPFLKRGPPPPGFSYLPSRAHKAEPYYPSALRVAPHMERREFVACPKIPPRKNKEKYNKNKERNEQRKINSVS